MTIYLDTNYLYEAPTINSNDIDTLPFDIHISTESECPSHNELRVKFKFNNILNPLRLNQYEVKLDNKCTIKQIGLRGKDRTKFFQMCDWMLANRDIIYDYYKCQNCFNGINSILMKAFLSRNEEIKQNPQKFKIKYAVNKDDSGVILNQKIDISFVPNAIDYKIDELSQTQVQNKIIQEMLELAGL